MLDPGRRIGLGGCEGVADGALRTGTGGGADGDPTLRAAGATLEPASGVRLRFGGGGGWLTTTGRARAETGGWLGTGR